MITEALGNYDLDAAKLTFIDGLNRQTQGKNSWDSPQFAGEVDELNQIKLCYDNDSLMTYFGAKTVYDRYLLRDVGGNPVEDIQKFFARVAHGISGGDVDFAQNLYEIISKHWFMPATPILVNSATTKGLPISCFLNTVGDSIKDIYKTYEENAFLAKGGGGIGTDWSQVRGMGARLSSGGLSTGIIPFLKVMDSSTLAVNQGGVRRGAAAAYLRVDHPDIEEFIDIRKPTGGDENRRCLNLHHGVTITDEFMEAVENKTTFPLRCPNTKDIVKFIEAVPIWRKILKNRIETGEPYLLFIDTVNKNIPEHHKKLGLEVKQSNLCSEITLPTNRERTAVCCLGSLNIEKWHEYSSQLEKVVFTAITALDNTLNVFIRQADKRDFRRAIQSAMSERSVGLGVMGWHGFLMENSYTFEGIASKVINKSMFQKISHAARLASEKLCIERGECPDGGGYRNSNRIAIAPTANISIICGEATPGIEPVAGMAYLHKTLSGSFLVKNKQLERYLQSVGLDTVETWSQIIADKGSVVNLDIPQSIKDIFKTAYEINMEAVISQAADRQKYICQSQSLNLFLPLPVSGKHVDKLHRDAWKLGIKSLYYLRSNSVIQAYDVTKECSSCQ